MKRRQKEVKRYAKNIIQKAREKSRRLLSESYLLECIRAEADKIKKQILDECLELKRKAKEEAKAIREGALNG